MHDTSRRLPAFLVDLVALGLSGQLLLGGWHNRQLDRLGGGLRRAL